MSTVNPYADNPDQGAAWDLGYRNGYDEPETDHEPPVAPDMVDVYREGELAGRDDRRQEPPSDVMLSMADFPALAQVISYGNDVGAYLRQLGIDPDTITSDEPNV